MKSFSVKIKKQQQTGARNVKAFGENKWPLWVFNVYVLVSDKQWNAFIAFWLSSTGES